MPWYDGDLKYRWPITLDNSLNATTSEDVTINIPAGWNYFWDNVKSDGTDVVIVKSWGGVTDFERQTWNFSAQTGVFRVDALAVQNQGMSMCWLYWGDANHGDEVSAVSIASPITGHVLVSAPGLEDRRISMAPPAPGVTQPRAQLQKTADEIAYLWWLVDPVLTKRSYPVQGSLDWEEVDNVSHIRVDLAGSEQGAMTTLNTTRFTYDSKRQLWCRTKHSAGSSGTDYTVRLALDTVEDTSATRQTLEGRALFKVQDPDET